MMTATSFGGSELGSSSAEYRDGIRLGFFLAQHGYTVRCGGYYGLMAAVARGVEEAGGVCLGITLSSFDPKVANSFVSKEQKEADIYDRLRSLIEGSQLFIVQRGSLGTLSELFLVWCLLYTGTLKDTPICLIGDCWGPILDSLRSLAVRPEEFRHTEVFGDVDEFFQSHGRLRDLIRCGRGPSDHSI